ncbi:MAG: hypothetical protein M1839_000905 [Geoglossum umbratile]|nr:MAG: hypothetical protein M1839_000905 [Geoglossum umbratile]
MNSNDLSMTFDGMNPKKIDVWMYIQNVETKAMIMVPTEEKGRYLIKIILLSEIYTYEQAKTAAEKVINFSTKALKPPVTTATPTWITATAQPAETPDPSSELARTLQEINKCLANLE